MAKKRLSPGEDFLIVPPGLTFWQALQRGYIPVLKSPAYLGFVASLPCVITGKKPVTVHHMVGHGLKGGGAKTSDLLVMPLAPELHLPDYPQGLHHLGHEAWEDRYGDQRVYVMQTLFEAICRGVLKL